jgi:hypothetical protein
MKIFRRLFQDPELGVDSVHRNGTPRNGEPYHLYPARNSSGTSSSKLYKTISTIIRILMRKYKDLISVTQLFLKNRSYENKNSKTSDFGGVSLRLEIYFAGEVPVSKKFFSN